MKNSAIAKARTSSGKISLTVRYAALAAAEAKKKMTLQQTVWLLASSSPCSNRIAVIAEPVEDPSDAERHDDEPVEPAPRQPVQTRRYIADDRPVERLCPGSAGCVHRNSYPGDRGARMVEVEG